MKNERSSSSRSHSSENRDSHGRFESDGRSSNSSHSNRGNSTQKRDSEGRFTSDSRKGTHSSTGSHRGRKSEK